MPLIGLMAVVLMLGSSCSLAQVKTDGPVSQELIDLAKEYDEYLKSDKPSFEFVPRNPTIRIDSGFVLIDATTLESGEELFAELSAHGMKNGSAYGTSVSGWFPIDSIAVAVRLTRLKFMRAAQMATGGVGIE
jgi:hypothetical protein